MTYDLMRKRAVFISSAFRELRDHRKALIDGTLTAGQIPVAMEFFIGETGRTLDFIERQIREADLFMTMVGTSLGSYPSDKDIHYVEAELEVAERCELPIIPVLLSEAEYATEVDAYRLSDRFDARVATQMDNLRARLLKTKDGHDRLAIFFSKKDASATYFENFRNTIALRLQTVVEALPKTGGWVPGRYVEDLVDLEVRNQKLRQALDTRGLSEGTGGNVFFRGFLQRMNDFDMLAGRLTRREDQKRGVADFFWRQYLTPIVERKLRYLYFESGSSTAYVCRSFIERMNERRAAKDEAFAKHLRIWTNNFVALLELLLTHPQWRWQNVQLFPFGDFFDGYGATYGSLLREVIAQAPPGIKKMRPDVDTLGKDALPAISKVANQLSEHFAQESLILMTASGIDTRRAMAKGDPPYTQDALFTPFPGPHVGDYHNMLIKRALLRQSCPKVLFMDDYKWGNDFRVDQCFPVCDAKFRWRTVIAQTPLAIGVATKDPERQEKVRLELARMGFVHARLETPPDKTLGPGETRSWSVIATNELFDKKLPPSN